MKVVIAGSRSIIHTEPYHYAHLKSICSKFEEEYGPIDMVVSGRANGPDKMGEKWALEHGRDIAKFPAKWDLHGKAAGPIRNGEMGEFADAAIILWDGKSKGSKHMSEIMRKLRKPFILDIFTPLEYNQYYHEPSGTVRVRKPAQSPSLNDPAYDDILPFSGAH